MKKDSLNIAIFGLSITSSWGNGHATTYRSFIKELYRKGHKVHFFERDMPWYAGHRDLPQPPFCQTILYQELPQLDQYKQIIQQADLVMVGSYVPEGTKVGDWVIKNAHGPTAFYDIDTPVTLAKLKRQDYEYLDPDLISRYDMYLSFSGGKILDILEKEYGSPQALPFHCSVDQDLYYPLQLETKWDFGYMGTYSTDRQPPLDQLMLKAARGWPRGKFVVAGPQYPDSIDWPPNLERFEHLPPEQHNEFYNQQRYTLNITRADMINAGYSPSVRLFEAAACGTPIISDWWEGLDTFFEPGKEILISKSPQETLYYLQNFTDEQRTAIGVNAKERVLKNHTAFHRAGELEKYVSQALKMPIQ
ncbi:MAG: CgeB family protein [Candidatus Cyclobacteriaceae bacterium M3_2C_046]